MCAGNGSVRFPEKVRTGEVYDFIYIAVILSFGRPEMYLFFWNPVAEDLSQ